VYITDLVEFEDNSNILA